MSISNFRGCLGCFFIFILFLIDILFANSDQTPRSVASDLGLHCLPVFQKWDTRLIWVKTQVNKCYKTTVSNIYLLQTYVLILFSFVFVDSNYKFLFLFFFFFSFFSLFVFSCFSCLFFFSFFFFFFREPD